MTSVTIYLDKDTARKLGELACLPTKNGDIIKPCGMSKAACMAIQFYHKHMYK